MEHNRTAETSRYYAAPGLHALGADRRYTIVLLRLVGMRLTLTERSS